MYELHITCMHVSKDCCATTMRWKAEHRHECKMQSLNLRIKLLSLNCRASKCRAPKSRGGIRGRIEVEYEGEHGNAQPQLQSLEMQRLKLQRLDTQSLKLQSIEMQRLEMQSPEMQSITWENIRSSQSICISYKTQSQKPTETQK